MRFLFAQILTVTRLEKLTLCSVERDLVQAADIDKIAYGQIFSAWRQSPNCTILRTVSEYDTIR